MIAVELRAVLAAIHAGKPIALVGARDAGTDALDFYRRLAAHVVRSGGGIVTGAADGVDAAAMEGGSAVDPSRVLGYIPWAGFGTGHFHRFNRRVVNVVTDRQMKIVRALHPQGANLRPAVLSLHARNVAIMDAAGACVAWPSRRTGGTRFAMAVAEHIGIPVVDASLQEVREALENDARAWMSRLNQPPKEHAR